MGQTPCELFGLLTVTNPEGEVVALNTFLSWDDSQQMYWSHSDTPPGSNYVGSAGPAQEVLEAKQGS